MIRQFDKLTQDQQEELMSVQKELNNLRHRLDNVMYGRDSLTTPDESIADIRVVYSNICKALDQY